MQLSVFLKINNCHNNNLSSSHFFISLYFFIMIIDPSQNSKGVLIHLNIISPQLPGVQDCEQLCEGLPSSQRTLCPASLDPCFLIPNLLFLSLFPHFSGAHLPVFPEKHGEVYCFEPLHV